MSDFIHIGKVEAAKRHLSLAIIMFFERKDPVVIYTVAWTAYQLISEICQKKGIKRIFEDSPMLEEFGVKKEAINAFRAPRNFFQHANTDHDKELKFHLNLAFLLPLLANSLLGEIDTTPFAPGKALNLWFYVKNPKIAPDYISNELKNIPFPVLPDDYELFLELAKKNYS